MTAIRYLTLSPPVGLAAESDVEELQPTARSRASGNTNAANARRGMRRSSSRAKKQFAGRALTTSPDPEMTHAIVSQNSAGSKAMAGLLHKAANRRSGSRLTTAPCVLQTL